MDHGTSSATDEPGFVRHGVTPSWTAGLPLDYHAVAARRRPLIRVTVTATLTGTGVPWRFRCVPTAGRTCSRTSCAVSNARRSSCRTRRTPRARCRSRVCGRCGRRLRGVGLGSRALAGPGWRRWPGNDEDWAAVRPRRLPPEPPRRRSGRRPPCQRWSPLAPVVGSGYGRGCGLEGLPCADSVMRTATAQAERAGGRLGPPMLAILDEAANVCKISDLPDLYSPPRRVPTCPADRLTSHQNERHFSVEISPVTPTPHIMRTHKPAGQEPSATLSRMQTHSTWCVIGKRSKARRLTGW